MKVTITGSRTLTDHWLLEVALAACPFAAEIKEVVCGGEEAQQVERGRTGPLQVLKQLTS